MVQQILGESSEKNRRRRARHRASQLGCGRGQGCGSPHQLFMVAHVFRGFPFSLQLFDFQDVLTFGYRIFLINSLIFSLSHPCSSIIIFPPSTIHHFRELKKKK